MLFDLENLAMDSDQLEEYGLMMLLWLLEEVFLCSSLDSWQFGRRWSSCDVQDACGSVLLFCFKSCYLISYKSFCISLLALLIFLL